MKRLLALIGGGLGFGALRHRLRRRPVLELGPSPADDLRAALAEARTDSAEELQAETPPPDDAEAQDPNARRQSVHDRAREAIDDLG